MSTQPYTPDPNKPTVTPPPKPPGKAGDHQSQSSQQPREDRMPPK